MQSLMGSDSSKLALLKEQNNMLDMISLRFDENKAYEAGDYCLYFNCVFDGLYRFKLPKVAGVWDGSAVESVSLSGVLKEHEKSLTQIKNEFTLKAIKIESDYFVGENESIAVKYGKVVVLSMNQDLSSVPAERTHLCTLPEEYWPSTVVQTEILGAPRIIVIVDNYGNIDMYNYGEAMTTRSGVWGTLTWITN